MNRILAAGIAMAIATINSGNISAAPRCGPHAKIVEFLGGRYKEDRQALGLAGQTSVIELFVSAAGSWTMTSTDTKGTTCVIAAGEAWQQAPQRLAGLES